MLIGIIIGSLVLALVLPLPAPKMPVATEIYDQNHQLVASFFTQNRRLAPLSEIPPFLKQAFLAVEDHRFYQHRGINPGRILKAAWTDLTYGRLAEGASTITQQLARSAYLDQGRNFTRKIKELFYALKLELHYSKDKIFELYLNQIYFGHGAYGVKVAATTYFNRPLDQLNQAEMALLAGLPKGPAYYSPYLNLPAARRRLREALQRMLECKYITAKEFALYSNQPLRISGIRPATQKAPYFLDLLQKEVAQIFPNNQGLIYKAGFKIESTLDLQTQKVAEQTFANYLPKLLIDSHGLSQPQGALIVVDPENGEIRALIGGTDYQKSQFNRAIQAKRQPGSAFKPILYTAALEHGYTLASQIDRTPKTYLIGAHTYRPLDKEDENMTGNLTLRDALAVSSNVVSVKLLDQLGFLPVINLANQLGVHSLLPRQLSLALGSGEVTPLELTTSYLPLSNGGTKWVPTTIRRILDHDGRVLYQTPRKPAPVLDPGISFLITQALTGVLKEGGTAANIGKTFNRPAAGKTGTTEGNHDAWFVGYTPDLLACVYVGCDQNERPLPGAANRIAAPIWAEFMKKALLNKPARDFTIPDNIQSVTICKETGNLATVSCPSISEYFLAGTEPTQYCEVHRFVDLEICARSQKLPGPYCQEREIKRFLLGEQPVDVCDVCKKQTYLFDWLWKLFHR
ncbi:MAG TPA: PBP1A family penicillin-binding protein [Bacillota bacterium]|nr:PBP1A family penicillin-binding protein [Bacillota bacterium]